MATLCQGKNAFETKFFSGQAKDEASNPDYALATEIHPSTLSLPSILKSSGLKGGTKGGKTQKWIDSWKT